MTSSQVNLIQCLVVLICFGIGAACATLLTFFPERILKFIAQRERELYKGTFLLSDEELDKLPKFPSTQFFVGARSRYINRAPEHPKKFSRVLAVYRTIGCAVWAMLGFGMCQ